jgi:hypothetical protein
MVSRDEVERLLKRACGCDDCTCNADAVDDVTAALNAD